MATYRFVSREQVVMAYSSMNKGKGRGREITCVGLDPLPVLQEKQNEKVGVVNICNLVLSELRNDRRYSLRR